MSTTLQIETTLASDLELARQVQMSLLPKQNCCIGNWRFAYSYQPAGTVGGDYVDLIPSDSGAFYFALGDVSGKGVASSMLMSHLHATLRALLTTGMTVEQVLKITSRTFCQNSLPAQFATLVLGRAEQSGNVELVNAGHTPVLLRENGEVRVIEAANIPVGMFCSDEFRATRFQVKPGSFLLIYSDGLTEAVDESGNEYGLQRLMQDFRELDELTASDVVQSLSEKIEAFTDRSPFADDRTILVLDRLAGDNWRVAGSTEHSLEKP